MTKQKYDPYDETFFCLNDKAWRIKSGCRWRAENGMDDCSPLCKQAIEENVFQNRVVIKRRIKNKKEKTK